MNSGLHDNDKADHTIRVYVSTVCQFAAWFEAANGYPLASNVLTPTDLRQYREKLITDNSKPTSTNRVIAALRAFGEWITESHDVANPSAVPRAEVEAWVAEGVMEYLGPTDDVRPYLKQADCVVLPSYREGVPRTLLEAAAMARPVITTDAPGCRDTVVDGKTGFLCRTADASDLAEKILRFIAMTPDARLAMGQQGRTFIKQNFDERLVIQSYLQMVNELQA